MNPSHTALIRLVAVFKFVKAAALIVTGFGLLKLIHTDLSSHLHLWVEHLGLDAGNRYVNLGIERVMNVPPKRIQELGLGSFVYAALFLTEGIGLWLLKRWGEWFTVIITGSLIPFEVYEIYRHPTAIKTAVLVINIAVVAYLLYHIHSEPGGRKRRR